MRAPRALGAAMAEPSIFDAARRSVTVADLAAKAVTLRKAGHELRGPCPLCGAGRKSKSGPFAVKDGRWSCFSCGLFGDVTDLERELNGGSLFEAAKRLVGGEWRSNTPAQPVAASAEAEGPSATARIAESMWKEARPFAGTLAERYLRGRGISEEIIALAAPRLRFHPNARWGWDEATASVIRHPAMLVRPETPSGPTGGVHATYLARDATKAKLSPPKRMWGPQKDAEGRAGVAWLIGPGGEGGLEKSELVVGEGIETVLSCATLGLMRGNRLRACAALSLGALQGGLLKDAEGAHDLDALTPNPEVPAAVWPCPAEAPWPKVWIAVDRDMSPIRIRARTPVRGNGRGGKVTWFGLDAEARARMCGRMARRAWLEAGAPAAGWCAPPPGLDFNDELRRHLALLARGAA